MGVWEIEHQNLSYAAMGYGVYHLGPAFLMNLFFHFACNLHHSKTFIYLSHLLGSITISQLVISSLLK